MKFSLKTGPAEKLKADCLIIGVYEKHHLSPTAQQIDKLSKKSLHQFLKTGDFTGKIGQTQMLYHLPGIQAERVLVVGCGPNKPLTLKQFRQIAQKSLAALTDSSVQSVVTALHELRTEATPEQQLQQGIFAAHENTYRFIDFKGKKTQAELAHQKPIKIEWIVDSQFINKSKKTLAQTLATVQGMITTKNLANTPGNVCHPSYMAEVGKKLARQYKKLQCKVLDEKAMKKLNMGAYLAVAKGSAQPPRLIALEYKGSTKSKKPIVLVGKGITFDTGGLSLKPGTNMMGMKFDMSGAAAVAGTMQAIAEMNLPIHVVGLMVCAENMPSDRATRPDDIVTTMSGQTVEIANTDAEGRLVLCDALTYAQKTYSPELIIDMATLTGAIVVALGQHASAVFANHQPLADALIAAGEQTLDRAWQMPLWEDYQSSLDSKAADMCNIGGPEGGSIVAACFLSRFTREVHWAHLDIAGTASTRMSRDGTSTGRPVALLTQYLINKAG